MLKFFNIAGSINLVIAYSQTTVVNDSTTIEDLWWNYATIESEIIHWQNSSSVHVLVLDLGLLSYQSTRHLISAYLQQLGNDNDKIK